VLSSPASPSAPSYTETPGSVVVALPLQSTGGGSDAVSIIW
jgi:hypothetical protein